MNKLLIPIKLTVIGMQSVTRLRYNFTQITDLNEYLLTKYSICGLMLFYLDALLNNSEEMIS